MTSAKELRVAPISASDANAFVRRIHYSGRVVPNSQLHLGVFLRNTLQGAMQFGPPMDKRKALALVPGTSWNGFLELNRMAFSEALPRNSESRAIAVALRLIRKRYQHVEWIVSYADGTQCGDGAIYRASGFVLTGIRQNTTIVRRPDGSVGSELVGGRHLGGRPLPGFQLRYIYFLRPEARARLSVPIIPFSRISEVGASMYRGQKRAGSKAIVAPPNHGGEGGETPTPALHSEVGDQTPRVGD